MKNNRNFLFTAGLSLDVEQLYSALQQATSKHKRQHGGNFYSRVGQCEDMAAYSQSEWGGQVLVWANHSPPQKTNSITW